jgi:hypothetical protein
MSGIDPNPLPIVQEGALSYQKESPLLVVKQREIWAEINEQRFHNEALQWFGEQVIVRQLWRAEDAAIGLVGYCQQCQNSPNPSTPNASGNAAIRSRVSQVYRQTGNSYCSTCYGTTFSGGFKPTCYHLFMLAADTAQIRANLSTGQFWRDNPTVQFGWYPEIRVDDLVVRVNNWNGDTPTATGDRFVVSTVNVQTVRTGPGISYDTSKIVNQFTTLENLPPSHPYYNVPLV